MLIFGSRFPGDLEQSFTKCAPCTWAVLTLGASLGSVVLKDQLCGGRDVALLNQTDLGITLLRQIHLRPVVHDLLLPVLGPWRMTQGHFCPPQAASAFTCYGLSPFNTSSCLEACRRGCNFTLRETAACTAPGCFAASFQMLLLPSAMKLLLPLHLLKGLPEPNRKVRVPSPGGSFPFLQGARAWDPTMGRELCLQLNKNQGSARLPAPM